MIDINDLSMLKFKLEHSINNQLKNPFTCKIATLDGLFPEIGVTDIVDEGGRVRIEVFIANTKAKRIWIANYKNQSKSTPPKIDKNDLEL